VVAPAPIEVVDLDRNPPRRPLPLETRVVVGFSRSGYLPALADGDVDVALAAAPSPPRPWVGCADLDMAVEAVVAAAASAPLGATVLAQVLRSSHGLDVQAGLVIESLAYSTLQGGPELRRWLEARPVRRGRNADPGDPVLVERSGGRITVTLNRPSVHNAYNASMRDHLVDALAVAEADPTVDEIFLRGNGPSYCSGGDLDEFGTVADPATGHWIRTGCSPARALAVLSERVTAVVHGSCVGSGVELAAFAGRVIAHPDTTFRLPELGMGLIPGAGGTQSIPRRIGTCRTAWMALTGAAITAPDAVDWGLVDVIAPS
jgi:hypothetical protein